MSAVVGGLSSTGRSAGTTINHRMLTQGFRSHRDQRHSEGHDRLSRFALRSGRIAGELLGSIVAELPTVECNLESVVRLAPTVTAKEPSTQIRTADLSVTGQALQLARWPPSRAARRYKTLAALRI